MSGYMFPSHRSKWAAIGGRCVDITWAINLPADSCHTQCPQIATGGYFLHVSSVRQVFSAVCVGYFGPSECAWSTCEGLCAGIDPSQPLGRAKIRYLQDATVGVDENIIALWNEDTFVRTTRTRSHTETPCSWWYLDNAGRLEIFESDRQQVKTHRVRKEGDVLVPKQSD